MYVCSTYAARLSVSAEGGEQGTWQRGEWRWRVWDGGVRVETEVGVGVEVKVRARARVRVRGGGQLPRKRPRAGGQSSVGPWRGAAKRGGRLAEQARAAERRTGVRGQTERCGGGGDGRRDGGAGDGGGGNGGGNGGRDDGGMVVVKAASMAVEEMAAATAVVAPQRWW